MFTDEEEKARRKRLGNHAPVLSGGKVQHTGPAASGPAAPGASSSGASTSGASTSGLSGTAAGRPVRGGAASASPGRAIPAPKPAAGRATRTPAPVIAAVERGDKLGAEPMSPMDVALGLTKNKLDLARTGKGRLGETFRKRFEEEGYRFGRGGKIMEDAPSPGGPRLDLTPGRGESGKTASGEEALAAIRRLGESPRGTEASLGKFKRGLSDRLPELTDEELPEAEKTLAEARARLTGSAKQTQDGLTRAAASASADTLDQAAKALKQESKLRQTTKPSDGEAEQPEAAKPGAQSPDGDSGAPQPPRIQLAQAPSGTATDATPNLIPAPEGDGSDTGGGDATPGSNSGSRGAPWRRVTPSTPADALPEGPPQRSADTRPLPTYSTEVRDRTGQVVGVEPRPRIADASEWADQLDALDKLGVSEAEHRAYREIFSAEGGLKIDDGTVGGIQEQTLENITKSGKEYVQSLEQIGIDPGVTKPKDLTPEQRIGVYRLHFNTFWEKGAKAVGERIGKPGMEGYEVLEYIGNEEAAAALADTFFRGGRGSVEKGSAAWITQRAINKSLGALREPLIVEDGRFGSGSIEAFKALSSDPRTRKQLLDNLAEERRKVWEGSPNFEGEAARADHFRMER